MLQRWAGGPRWYFENKVILSISPQQFEQHVKDTCPYPRMLEPIGEHVQHCNIRTGYQMIDHLYLPLLCPECRFIQRIVWQANGI